MLVTRSGLSWNFDFAGHNVGLDGVELIDDIIKVST
jgi:hypothetical protein